MTQHEIVWIPWDEPGMEHLMVSPTPNGGVAAESVVLGLTNGQPFTVRYRIEVDAHWSVRLLAVDERHGGSKIELLSDGNGSWKHADGASRADLDGCIDVDIAVTPLTNTLPIRRLKFEAGQSCEIAVVYVSAPPSQISVEKQRYTCLEKDRRYRFESVDGGFTADLPVDDEAMVLDYPGLFRRVNLGQDQNR